MVDSFSLARKILLGEEVADAVISDFHSQTYDYLNQTNISVEVVDERPEPSESHDHEPADLDVLMYIILTSPRYVDSESMNKRIEEEIEFFSRTKNIFFVFYCMDLIEKFKERGIVWGVGRGSSCASLVFYLLEITDVNPLKYGIKFHELSKEM